MAGSITNEQLYEILQEMRNDLAELKRDSRYLKGEIVSIHNIVLGKSIKSDVRNDD